MLVMFHKTYFGSLRLKGGVEKSLQHLLVNKQRFIAIIQRIKIPKSEFYPACSELGHGGAVAQATEERMTQLSEMAQTVQ